jgi:hypothetical protein
MVDDMHHWYHDAGIVRPDLAGLISGIHVHDSLVVLDKAQVFAPTHSVVGDRRRGRTRTE